MLGPNRVLTCHHINLQDGCQWCEVYKQQKIRECDRCHCHINTDAAYLALVDPRPQLICVGCHLWELNTREVE